METVILLVGAALCGTTYGLYRLIDRLGNRR